MAREGTLLSVAQALVIAALQETEAEGEHTALGLVTGDSREVYCHGELRC